MFYPLQQTEAELGTGTELDIEIGKFHPLWGFGVPYRGNISALVPFSESRLSFIRSLIHLVIRPFVCSFVLPIVNSFICSFIQFIHSFSHYFVYLFVHSSIHSFIHPFIHSYIYQLLRSFT